MAAPHITGTHATDSNPWDSYASEMATVMTPELEAAIAEYAEKNYEADQTSSQNKEEYHRQKEMSDELSKEYQWLKPEDYKNQDERIGRVMSHIEFLTILRKTGLNYWYNRHIHPDKANLMVYKNVSIPPEVACWVQVGQMPELSMMAFDDHGVPLAERRRGWRTCVLQLILKGHITEREANKLFGEPKQTPAYHRYNSLLKAFRDNGNSLDE